MLTQSIHDPSKKEIAKLKKQLRQAVADYMASEGCTCCRNIDAHQINNERLARLLNVPKYKDGSGRNFSKFKSN